jgi:hypothetical protein
MLASVDSRLREFRSRRRIHDWRKAALVVATLLEIRHTHNIIRKPAVFFLIIFFFPVNNLLFVRSIKKYVAVHHIRRLDA